MSYRYWKGWVCGGVGMGLELLLLVRLVNQISRLLRGWMLLRD